MKAFRATYTPRVWEETREGTAVTVPGGRLVSNRDKTRTVLVIKICGPEPEINPQLEKRRCLQVVFIDSDAKLAMGTMDCFSDCQWEEGKVRVTGNIYENPMLKDDIENLVSYASWTDMSDEGC